MVRKLLLIFFALSSVSYAAEENKHIKDVYILKESQRHRLEKEEQKKYKNWSSISALLNEQNIAANDINWHEIAPLCLNIQRSTVETNKCRYKKAIDQVQYKRDLNYCKASAQNIPFGKCMYDLDWNDPDSWKAGRREEYENR